MILTLVWCDYEILDISGFNTVRCERSAVYQQTAGLFYNTDSFTDLELQYFRYEQVGGTLSRAYRPYRCGFGSKGHSAEHRAEKIL